MQNQLQRAIDLVKKTGDKIIVFDSANSDNVYAIMSLKDYENLVFGRSEVRDLTEDELLDKINRDIAIWKSEQNNRNEINEGKRNLLNNFDFNKERSCDFDDHCDCDEEEFEEEEFEMDSSLRGNDTDKTWSIPKDVKESADEIIEEDRQYLENVTF